MTKDTEIFCIFEYGKTKYIVGITRNKAGPFSAKMGSFLQTW